MNRTLLIQGWVLASLTGVVLTGASCDGGGTGGAGGGGGPSSSSVTSASSTSSTSTSASSTSSTSSTSTSSSSGAGGMAACANCTTLATLPMGSAPYGITVDANYVYWTNSGSGEVMKIKLDGTGQETIATGQGAPFALTIDNGYLFWVSYSVDGVMRKAPIAGGAPIAIIDAPTARDIVVLGNTVFWTREPDDVQTVPIDGLPEGGSAGLLSGNQLTNGIAVDATNIYWVNRQDGYIKKADHDLSNETPLSIGNVPWDVAVDGTTIYWTERGIANAEGKVLKAQKSDGTGLVELATGLARPEGMAIDATHIYWASSGDGTIVKVPIAGGAPTVIAMGQAQPENIAVDGTHVYWTDTAANVVVKAPK